MSAPAPEAARQAAPTLPMLLVLTGIAMLSGLLVVMVYQLTKPAIEANQLAAIEAAVFQVVPGAVSQSTYVVGKDSLTPYAKGMSGERVYAGYDKDGKLLGVAINAGAQGYAGMIYLLYGYDPACQCIRGIKVLKMVETPGLGDKILSNQDFLANFEALDAKLNADGTALANPIVTVKHGTKTDPWQIDAISGATISSNAVGKALDQAGQRLLPKIVPHLAILRDNPPKPEAEK
ncbi:MAG: FMN-binding protein [Hyphomicrobiales bacterium]|nr:MAG: FMN-binding protein [Hyphomicrobiales bacterium]